MFDGSRGREDQEGQDTLGTTTRYHFAGPNASTLQRGRQLVSPNYIQLKHDATLTLCQGALFIAKARRKEVILVI
jgi:hypothetical protein